MVYRALLFLVGLAIDLFYRREVVGGAVPARGPLIVVANHPNGLIDPVVVARTAKRTLRMLAKEPLFRMPVIGWIVRNVYCLPVYRKKDGHSTDKNDETFRAVDDALMGGDAIALFPEGISHNEPKLQALKTGAARMALSATRAGAPVRIVPIGLFYEDKPAFRSRVLVKVGEPLEVSATDPRALTDNIAAALLELTVNVEDAADLSLLHVAERIWPADDVSEFERKVAIARAEIELRAQFPDEVSGLRARVAALGQQLKELNLDVDSLDSPTFARVVPYTLRNLVALVIGLPLALLGGLAYGLPYLVVKALPLVKKLEDDVLTTGRIMLSLLLFPAWHVALQSALLVYLEWPLALVIGLTLPFAGLYAYRFGARRLLALRRAGFAWTDHARRLREERDDIGARMVALLDQLEVSSS